MTTPSPLADLLDNPSRRVKCIDRITEHMSDILHARDQKITWEAIAAAMGMKRCTLINAVKTVQSRAQPMQKRTPHLPFASTAIAVDNKSLASVPVTNNQQEADHSIKTVGRAQRDQFNF